MKQERWSLGWVVAAISGVTLASACVAAATCVAVSPRLWFLFIFECVTIAASVFGLMTGMGRFREGRALALLMVAGAIGLGSLLGSKGADWNLRGFDLWYFFLARSGVAGVLMGLAGWTVLSVDPGRSIPILGKGVACGVGFVMVAGLGWMGRNTLLALPAVIQVLADLVLAALGLGLLAASIHLTIGAFLTCLRPVEPSAQS